MSRRVVEDRTRYQYDRPEDYEREATYAEDALNSRAPVVEEKVTTTTHTRISNKSPSRRRYERPIVGHAHTRYVGNTIPVYESHSPTGNHLVISADATRPLGHPLAELVTSVTTKEGIHNSHIENMFDRSREIVEVERNSNRLDTQGKILARDTENILEALERLFVEKNRDELLQHMFLESARSAKTNVGFLKTKGIPTGGITSATTNLAGTFRELAISLLRSGELREILNESLELFRDLLREKQKVAPTTSTFIPTTQATVLPAVDRVVRTEYEVKNVQSQPFVERTVISEETKPSFVSLRSGPVLEGTSYPTSEYMESKDHITDRFINLLRRFGSKPEFQRAVKDIVRIIDSIGENMTTLKDPQNIPVDTTHSVSALRDARKLLEGFTGQTEMKRFRTHGYALYEDVKSNQEMSAFFSHLRSFIISSVENPASLDDPNKRREVRELVKLAQRLLRRPEWGSRFRDLNEDARVMLNNIRKDTHTTNFTNKLEIFMKDFALNSRGKPDLWLMDDSLHQLKLILVPLLRNHLDNIPIDRIEYSSPKFEMVLEDLMFSASDILPSHMRLSVKNQMDMNLYNVGLDSTTHTLKLTVDHINPLFRNLRFYFRKKTGFTYEDYGVADIEMKGAGMSINIHWKLKSATGLPPAVYLSKVSVVIHNLYIHFDKAKHSFIDKLVTSLFLNIIKRRIAQSIASFLQLKITQIDDQINFFFAQKPLDRVINRADTAIKAAVERSSTKALQAEKEKKKKQYRESKGTSQPSFRATLRNTLSQGIKGFATGGSTRSATAVPSESTTSIPSSSYTTSIPSYATTSLPTYSTSSTYPSYATTTTIPSGTYVSSIPSQTTFVYPEGTKRTFETIPSTSYSTGMASNIPAPVSYREEKIVREIPGDKSVRFVENIQKQSV